MKQCSTCGESKPHSEFHKDKRLSTGLNARCKPCQSKRQRELYESSDLRRQGMRESATRRVQSNREAVIGYLKSHPCIYCGEDDPVVLEFDHRGSKLKEIAVMVNHNGLETLMAEIAKCDVRCANCHRRKTASDFGFWKVLN